MRELPIIKVVPRRPFGIRGYRESDNDYIRNNIDAAVQLLDREVQRARNARRRKK